MKTETHDTLIFLRDFVKRFKTTFKNCSQEQFLSFLSGEFELTICNIRNRNYGPYVWEWTLESVMPDVPLNCNHAIRIELDDNENANVYWHLSVNLHNPTLKLKGPEALTEAAGLIKRLRGLELEEVPDETV